MPLPRPVPFVSQQGDPTGCWFACAQMLRMYFGGSNAKPERIPELENPDGTHKRLDPSSYAKFRRNENLEPLSHQVPLNSAGDVDAALTRFGPIMFSWDGGLHVSLIVGTMGLDAVYHDPAVGPGQFISVPMLQVRRMGGGGFTEGMLIRNTNLRQAITTPKELSLSSDGVIKKYPMQFPRGWWKVYDGGTWYYYLGDRNVAMSSKSPPPAGPPTPPAKGKIHNVGRWDYAAPKTLVITWNKVAGAPKACQETFYNATEECEQMNATSNLYCPLLAKRYRT